MNASGISPQLRALVAEQAGNRCGYCLTRQEYVPWPLEIEHIIPIARGGGNERKNLWVACRSCNSYTGAQVEGIDPFSGNRVSLFNPRQQ